MAETKNKKDFMQHSYSKLSVYETCPHKFYWKYMEKVEVERDRTALDRGIAIHDKAEKFATGKLKKLPKELKVYADEFSAIRDLGATGEMDLSFDVNYQPCKWDDWGTVWVINKPDAMVISEKTKHIDVIDYKTGGLYPEHKDQSDMGALATFVHYPKVDSINSEFWYLDKPDEEPGQWAYERDSHFNYLKRNFFIRYLKMFKDSKFKKKPSYKCRWCEYNNVNGGQCNQPK